MSTSRVDEPIGPQPPPIEYANGVDVEAMRAAEDENLSAAPEPVGMRERAQLCVFELFVHQGVPVLRYTSSGDWFEWADTHWIPAVDAKIRDRICAWLSEHRRWSTKLSEWVFYLGTPEPKTVDKYIITMRGLLLTEDAERAWLDGDPPAPTDELIPMANGLLHWPTRTLHPHSPRFFNLSCLAFDYSADAECPAWRKTLDQWWPEDPQSADLLQEAFGYTVANRRELQKFFLVRGPTRSGKGVASRVLADLCGSSNVTSTSPRALGKDFGTASLIGKTLALITDARTAGVDDLGAMTEELLTITGCDVKAVRRKNKEDWIGVLRCNIWSFSNNNLKMPDTGSAITGRAVFIDMGQSFLGREDTGLQARLAGELAGIFNWSIAGLLRLVARGRGFIESNTSEQTRARSREASNPVVVFLGEKCIRGPEERERRSTVYEAWKQWNKDTEGKPGRPDHLLDLLTAQPGITTLDARDARYFVGFRLCEVTDP